MPPPEAEDGKPRRRGGGYIKGVTIPSLRGNPVILVEGTEWVAADPTKEGGGFFVNPLVGIKPGDVLLVEYSSGVKSLVKVNRMIGTVKQKQARVAPKKTREINIFDQVETVPIEDDEDDY